MFAPVFAELAALLNNFDFAALSERMWRLVLANGPRWAENIVGAGLIFALGSWGARIAIRVLERVLERTRLDETLAKFLCRIAHAFLIVFVVVSGLDRLGVNTTSLAAILAAAGLAIGMSLQGSLSNFAAGVMMIVFRPFKVGDYIQAGGANGTVEEIHVFHTFLRTGDNTQVIVPNNAITSGNITNFSRKPKRRIDLVVGCGYNDDLRAVKQFLEGLVNSHPKVLKDPAPVVAVDDLGAHSVNLVVRPWVLNVDYGKVRWDLIEQIKLGFDEHGFQIPFPQQEVHVHALPERVPQAKRPASPPTAAAPVMEPIAQAPVAARTPEPPSPTATATAAKRSFLKPRRAA